MTSRHPLRHVLASAPLRALLGALLAGGLLSAPAWSASVVELRVGRHPTFTRVVFELDSPSGYRVERQEGAGGATTIVVTLEAKSAPRAIRSKGPLLESVSIEGERSRAVARIRLRQGGLRLKEMILANPPRIVLDVMSPEAEPPSASFSNRDLEPPQTQASPPEPAAEPARPPQPAPTAAKQEPTAVKPIAVVPAPDRVAKPEVGTGAPPALPVVPPAAGPLARIETPPAPEGPALAESPEPAAPVAVVLPGPELPRAEAKPGAPGKPVATAKPSLIVPGTQPSGPFGLPLDTTSIAIAAAAVFAVVLVTLLVMLRRRRRDADRRTAEDRSDSGSPFDAFGASETSEEFGSLEAGGAGAGPGGARAEHRPFAESATSLFDDDDEKGDEPMQRTETQMATMDAGLPMARSSVRGDSDLARVVSELERRLAQAEARLDETVETCERMERQVAAQSEELRVQRAAIARTQRALRSLSRSEEEQATEPALREPR